MRRSPTSSQRLTTLENADPPNAASAMSTSAADPRLAAEQFIAPARLTKVLGSGTDGIVFHTSRTSAVKVHLNAQRLQNELAVYRRLDELGVRMLGMFQVPHLIGWETSRLLIEISAVEPPFLIDFGKSRLLEDWEDASTAEFEAKFEREFTRNARRSPVRYFRSSRTSTGFCTWT